jgi:hemolysin III
VQTQAHLLPTYRPAEIRADAVVHAVGLFGAIVACVALVLLALPRADALRIAALSVYAAGLLGMLGCSALYNLTRNPALRARRRRFDHAMIFVMIAGTYTPFLLLGMGTAWGIALLAFIWIAALAGGLMKLFGRRQFRRLSVLLYLLLGWCILLVMQPLLATLSGTAVLLVGVGGLIYSLGTVFHLSEKLPYHNVIWHVFVLVAAGCHYAAVLREFVLRG